MAWGTKTMLDVMSAMSIGAKGLSNNDNSKWANFNDNDAASETTFWSSGKIMSELSTQTSSTNTSVDDGIY